MMARSRTFIPGKLEDNPFLSRTNYEATLAALPEEMRAAYKDGKFDESLADHPKQVIKTEWIIAAQERWKASPKTPQGVPMTAMGLDVAQGGPDATTLAWRYDAWYRPGHLRPWLGNSHTVGCSGARGRASPGWRGDHRRLRGRLRRRRL